ncbi:PTS sugar transporter subunit IIA [Lactiplantibacillus herbarum]|uniref:PTS sugar transporter subunit IIA domain-containing protein n=1 Tax=Lactiplantibacillus herbarum TaxID=1670446 RepID=UPI00064F1A8F|nr:PTS sugar transporter subunit IIA [Lactiplantibacillus herbarum]
MKIIVTGHGNYADGLQSTVKLLAGELANVAYINFTGAMDDTALRVEFEAAIEGSDQVVFMCDLIGGTPFKEAVKLSDQVDQDVAVTSGCNIGSLLEVGLQLADYQGTAAQLATRLVAISKTQTTVFQHRAIVQDDEEDGI